VGWLSFSGEKAHARHYLEALELLASLRLCSNVPGQWAVQTALGGYQSINELITPGGRLYDSRAALLAAVGKSRHLSVTPPSGAMYAFIRVDTTLFPSFDDEQFALDLLERKSVLVAPGSSFNVAYRDHFRVTLLPEPKQITRVIGLIDDLLDEYAET
jgi:alanine-synthesizing transaminase